MYAAARLIGQTSEDENIDVPDGLLDKLEDWLLNNTGMLSMYTAGLLQYYESEQAEQIQLKKLEQDDFFMVHWDCLMGLVRINRTKYLGLVKSTAEDETKHEELRKACQGFLDDHRLSDSD